MNHDKVVLDNGRIVLLQGDCLEWLPKVKQSSVDMVFADLPYGTTDCKWDQIISFDELWSCLNRVMTDRSAQVFTAREPFTSILVASNIKNYHHKWVWNKKQSGSWHLAKIMPLQIEEDVIVFGDRVRYYPQMRTGKIRTKGGQKPIDREMSVSNRANGTPTSVNDQYYPVNIIDLAAPRTGNVHPTQKPVELLEYLIKTYTNENDVVLDPTMGSGTTGVACAKLKRRFIGIEKEQHYFEIAVRRIQEALHDQAH